MSQGSAKGIVGATGIQGVTGPAGLQGVTGAAGIQGATGAGVGGGGTAIINFGSAPGTNMASIIVTGQTGILITSNVQAFVMDDSTSDHISYEHIMFPMAAQLVCNTVVAGTGFTITAVSTLRLTGAFSVRWFWN
jgi:hypothetical protein